MSPLTKFLLIALAISMIAAGAASKLLYLQIGKTAEAEQRAEASEKALQDLTHSVSVWTKTSAAVDERLAALQKAAGRQQQKLDKLIGDGARENPEWAGGRVPADVVAGLCDSGLVSEAATADLCSSTAAPAH